MLTASLRVDLKLRELRRRILAKRRRVLFRVGGYTKSVMANRIRSAKKKTSKSPSPPKSKTKKLKRGVRFDVEESAGEVHVGFVKFRSDQAEPLGGQTVPSVIDRGGRERLHQDGRTVVGPDGKERKIEPRTVTAEYDERPLVDPVRKPAEDKLRELMRDVPL